MKYPTIILFIFIIITSTIVGCGETNNTQLKNTPIHHKADTIIEEPEYTKPPYLIAITENNTLNHWVDSLNTKSNIRNELDTIIYGFYDKYYIQGDTVKLLITDINKNMMPEFTFKDRNTVYEWDNNKLNVIISSIYNIDTIVKLSNTTFLRSHYGNIGGDFHTYYTLINGELYEEVVWLNPYMRGEWNYSLKELKTTNNQIIVDYEFEYFIPAHYYYDIVDYKKNDVPDNVSLVNAKLTFTYTWTGKHFILKTTSNKPFTFNLNKPSDFPEFINHKELFNPNNYPVSDIRTFLIRKKHIDNNNLTRKARYKYLFLLRRDHKVIFEPPKLKGSINVPFDKIFDAVSSSFDTRTHYNVIDSILVRDVNNDNKYEYLVYMSEMNIYVEEQGDSLVLVKRFFKEVND